MSNITLQEEGRRVYVIGNTFAIKDQIKEAGGHWDADRKAWWVGAGKKAEIEKAIHGASSAPSPEKPERKEEEQYNGEVLGKAEYKGRSYFVRWHGTTSKGTEAFRLVGFDGRISFWADAAEVKWTKHYEAREFFRGYGAPRRAEYPTLRSIRKFAEEKKTAEKNPDDCPRCNRLFITGKARPYCGSGDYEDCPQCGCTIEITF